MRARLRPSLRLSGSGRRRRGSASRPTSSLPSSRKRRTASSSRTISAGTGPSRPTVARLHHRLTTPTLNCRAADRTRRPSLRSAATSPVRRPALPSSLRQPPPLTVGCARFAVHCETEDRTTTILRVFDNDTRPFLSLFLRLQEISAADPPSSFVCGKGRLRTGHVDLALGALGKGRQVGAQTADLRPFPSFRPHPRASRSTPLSTSSLPSHSPTQNSLFYLPASCSESETDRPHFPSPPPPLLPPPAPQVKQILTTKQGKSDPALRETVFYARI